MGDRDKKQFGPANKKEERGKLFELQDLNASATTSSQAGQVRTMPCKTPRHPKRDSQIRSQAKPPKPRLQARRPKQHHPHTREGHRPSKQSHSLLSQDGWSPSQPHQPRRQTGRPLKQPHPPLNQDRRLPEKPYPPSRCIRQPPLKAQPPPATQTQSPYPPFCQELCLPQPPSWKDAHKFPRWRVQDSWNMWTDRHKQEMQTR